MAPAVLYFVFATTPKRFNENTMLSVLMCDIPFGFSGVRGRETLVRAAHRSSSTWSILVVRRKRASEILARQSPVSISNLSFHLQQSFEKTLDVVQQGRCRHITEILSRNVKSVETVRGPLSSCVEQEEVEALEIAEGGEKAQRVPSFWVYSANDQP